MGLFGRSFRSEQKPTLTSLRWQTGDVVLDQYVLYSTGRMYYEPLLLESGSWRMYQVRNRDSGDKLSVKVWRIFDSTEDEEMEGIYREIETWAKVDPHPNILGFRFCRRLGGVPAVFAELPECGTLQMQIDSRRLYEGGQVAALGRVLDIAIQTACGLGHVHAKGYVHRDIKPSHIMMMDDNIPKLMFSAGYYTPAFCSPEQHKGETLSPQTDMWSWGLSVSAMFKGEVSWQEGSIAPYVLKDYSHSGSVDSPIPKMPRKLYELLERCFKGDAADRPKDMGEIVECLKETYREESGEDYPRTEPVASESTEEQAEDLVRKGISMMAIRRPEPAVTYLQNSVAIEPDRTIAWFYLGLAQVSDRQRALQCFKKVLEARHLYPETAQLGMGRIPIGSFCSVWDIRLDLDRQVVWISGDPGMAFKNAGKMYAPYGYDGEPVDPSGLRELPASSKWFQYAADQPRFLVVDEPTVLGISPNNKGKPPQIE